MKLSEVFARADAKANADYAERLAYEATPEGAAEVAARREYEARIRAADERFAAENPPDPYTLGVDAAFNGEDREPPRDLDDAAEGRWLAGFDSEVNDGE